VDWCVPLNGPNVDVLARLFFGSFLRLCDVRGVTFHIIDRGIDPAHMEQVRWLLRDQEVVFYNLPVPPDVMDVVYCANWCLEHCGERKWCILSHFDILFHRDYLMNLRNRLSEEVGQLGQHGSGIILLNRQAFRESVFKFFSMAPFYLVDNQWPAGRWKLRFKEDRRIGGNCFELHGFDVGELLELELRVKGWRVEPLEEEYNTHFEHLRGGGSEFLPEQVAAMRSRAQALIDAYGF
jgi:hypothetical protein